MKLMLDTNVYTALRNGHQGVVDRIREAEFLVMSTVVLGELHFGFRHGTRYDINASSLRQFLDQPVVSVADVTQETAERFGLISTSLRSRGKPIPTNDIWIASQTFETGARLLTFDKHFDYIENLPRSVVMEG